MNARHHKAIHFSRYIYILVNEPKCKFTLTLHNIGLFRGQKSKFSWGTCPKTPPTQSVISTLIFFLICSFNLKEKQEGNYLLNLLLPFAKKNKKKTGVAHFTHMHTRAHGSANCCDSSANKHG